MYDEKIGLAYLKNYNNRKLAYYTQGNNSHENIIKTILGEVSREIALEFLETEEGLSVRERIRKWGHLETCGPSSVINSITAINVIQKIKDLEKMKLQPEDAYTSYLNDPTRQTHFEKYRKDINLSFYMENRIPQILAAAIAEFFPGMAGEMVWSFDAEDVLDDLKDDIATIACLRDPGHYIALVAAKEKERTIIYNDSWKNNYWPPRLRGTDAFNREVGFAELEVNAKPWRIRVYEK